MEPAGMAASGAKRPFIARDEMAHVLMGVMAGYSGLAVPGLSADCEQSCPIATGTI